MKNKIILITTVFLAHCMFSYSQTQIIKLDNENGAFRNFPVLPHNELFSIEGEIETDVSLVEVKITEEKTNKKQTSYSWNRSKNNLSESFEVLITEPLKANSAYSFNIKTFKPITLEDKKKLLSNVLIRCQHLIKGSLIVKGNKVRVDNAKKLILGLNQIIEQGTSLQRSKNGIVFTQLSDLVQLEVYKLDKFKVKNFLKRKKGETKEISAQKVINDKVDYLTELILTEIKPFIASELVQQFRAYSIANVKTQRDKFTLPINAGLYAWNFNSNINNVSLNNTGLTPGIGLTIPFKRTINVKGRSLPSLGLSVGVLTNTIRDGNNATFGVPTLNLPVYGALGVNFLRVVRINAGTIMFSNLSAGSSKFQFIPTVGIALELDAWLGVKR